MHNNPTLSFSTIQEAFVQGSAFLQTQASPTLDIECLLQFVLQMRKEQIYIHLEQTLTHTQQEQLQALLVRRQHGEPVAYLIGSKEFYGRNFHVDRRVLIPRPETEQLIEAAKKYLPADEELHMLDIGTGSGCLAITLALEFKYSHVTAWEVNLDALEVARSNAQQLSCNNITFVQHDMFADLPQTAMHFDLIVANPPYILPSEKTSLPASVLNYEPHTALFTNQHGLLHYQRIATIARQLLHTNGLLCLELNPNTAQAIEAIFLAQGFKTIAKELDLQGLVRTLTLRKTISAR